MADTQQTSPLPIDQSTASFGYWIRRQRQALDLTQAALARQVGCATVTVSKLERDERRPSRQMAELLAVHLAVPEEQRARFLAAALGERAVDTLPLTRQPVDPPVSAPSLPAQPSLPVSLAPAILRAAEEESLLALLENPAIRLVTITGPGGVGKTHISLRMAERAGRGLRDGAVFVALDATHNPEQVLTTLAGTLGIRESAGQGLRESLLVALSHRRQLLVLDNFEQVLDAAELVDALARNCPRLKILVTSRERLGLTGEQLFPLKPLALPTNDGAAALAQNPAVQLFALRARSVQPDFVLDDATAPTVAAICAALDGLPLAIELAAARLALFSLPSLLRELSGDEHSPLRLLRSQLRDAPRRHRSLADAVRWSYELLTDDEQHLFRRLSVFVGSFSLDAAQAIAGDGDDILEGVSSLVAKSLLTPRPQDDGATRFAYLQTIRDAALALLEESGETRAIHLAHARWYAALAAESEEKIHTREQIFWLDRLKAEADNIHAGIGWSIDNGESTLALNTGASLSWFWWLGNLVGVGNRWMKQLLPLLTPSVPPALQAKVYLCAGLMGQLQGDYTEASRLYASALAQVQESGSARLETAIRHQVGWVAAWQRDLETALAHYEEAIRIGESHRLRFELAVALSNFANGLVRVGRLEEAVDNARRAYEINQEDDNHWGMSWALIQMAHPLLVLNRASEARQYAQEGRRQGELLNDKLAIAWSLSSLGRIAFSQKKYAEARRLWGEMLELRWNLGDIHGVVGGIADMAQIEKECKRFAQAVIFARIVQKEGARMGAANAGTAWMQPDEIIAAARAALSPEEFAAAWAEGEARALADVVEELLHPHERVEEVGYSQ